MKHGGSSVRVKLPLRCRCAPLASWLGVDWLTEHHNWAEKVGDVMMEGLKPQAKQVLNSTNLAKTEVNEDKET